MRSPPGVLERSTPCRGTCLGRSGAADRRSLQHRQGGNVSSTQRTGTTRTRRHIDGFESFKDCPVPRFPVSAPDLLDFQRDQRSFEGLGAYQNKEYELGGSGAPERIVGARVTANLFPLLGVEPVLGRSFAQEEDEPGRGVVIITHRLWQRDSPGTLTPLDAHSSSTGSPMRL
jgi:hypothetical protein